MTRRIYENSGKNLFQNGKNNSASPLFRVGVSARIFLAAVLGGIIAVLWIYGGTIEKALDPNFSGTAKYLSEQNLKWAMLGCALFVLLVAVLHGISVFRREIIVTEDKFLYKSGVGSVESIMLPLSAIRYIDVRQNVFQSMLGYGKIRVITDGEEPFKIGNLVRPEKFARKIMYQCSIVRENVTRPQLRLDMAGNRRRGSHR